MQIWPADGQIQLDVLISIATSSPRSDRSRELTVFVGCAARLKLVQDSGSLLRVLLWRNLPIGEQLIDSRKSHLHGLRWLGQTFDLSIGAELLPEPLHSRRYVVNVSGR
jgi:hypothetical protein